MDAISLWQPYASLIAVEAKPFETRHWAPPRRLIGKRIAIHAARKIEGESSLLAWKVAHGRYGDELARKLAASIEGFSRADLLGNFRGVLLPIGCVVCTAVLDAVFQVGERAEGTAVPSASIVARMEGRPYPPCFTVRYDDFGDYRPGRWAWSLVDVRPLTPPIKAIGRQGLFSIELPEGA